MHDTCVDQSHESEPDGTQLEALLCTSRTLSQSAKQSRTACLLGEHLGVDQAHFSETIGQSVTIHSGYDRGLAPMIGTVHLADVERLTRLIATSPAGRTVVCRDIDADPTIWPGQAALIARAGAEFRAFVAVPLRKADARIAILAVHSIAPRRWTDDEVALIKETAADVGRGAAVTR